MTTQLSWSQNLKVFPDYKETCNIKEVLGDSKVDFRSVLIE